MHTSLCLSVRQKGTVIFRWSSPSSLRTYKNYDSVLRCFGIFLLVSLKYQPWDWLPSFMAMGLPKDPLCTSSWFSSSGSSRFINCRIKTDIFNFTPTWTTICIIIIAQIKHTIIIGPPQRGRGCRYWNTQFIFFSWWAANYWCFTEPWIWNNIRCKYRCVSSYSQLLPVCGGALHCCVDTGSILWASISSCERG